MSGAVPLLPLVCLRGLERDDYVFLLLLSCLRENVRDTDS